LAELSDSNDDDDAVEQDHVLVFDSTSSVEPIVDDICRTLCDMTDLHATMFVSIMDSNRGKVADLVNKLIMATVSLDSELRATLGNEDAEYIGSDIELTNMTTTKWGIWTCSFH